MNCVGVHDLIVVICFSHVTWSNPIERDNRGYVPPGVNELDAWALQTTYNM